MRRQQHQQQLLLPSLLASSTCAPSSNAAMLRIFVLFLILLVATARAQSPPSPTVANGTLSSSNTTQQLIGSPCESPDQCSVANSHCLNQTCVCKEGFSTQASAGSNSSCVPQSATPSPVPPSSGGGKKQHNYQPSQGENMVPIIVCLAIMFVGMCVALQLFSRARFRNQRTVFNSPNPRLLHLMKHDSKKRRHSHAGVGGGSRRPSCASNISMSRGSRPNSRMGSRAGSPDLRKQAALNNVAVIDLQHAPPDEVKALHSTELASLVEKAPEATA